MKQDEWLARYGARLMQQAKLTAEQVEFCLEAETFETLSEFFEDDPEGAADEELSCWID